MATSAFVSLAQFKDVITTSGGTVTLAPDSFYKIDATSGAVTINTTEVPAGKWGRDSYIELDKAGSDSVIFGNNIQIRGELSDNTTTLGHICFRSGAAIVYIEESIPNNIYTVVAADGTGAGTMQYGIEQTGSKYQNIYFDSSLNSSVVSTGEGSASEVKNFIGNGKAVGPTISGGIQLTSGYFKDCKLGGLVIAAGTAFIDETVDIPSGETLALSGGKLSFSSVSATGGTIDFGSTGMNIAGATVTAGGIQFTGGTSSTRFGVTNGRLILESCSMSGAASTYTSGDVFVQSTTGILELKGCTAGLVTLLKGGSVTLDGTNNIRFIQNINSPNSGYVIISSGAVVSNTRWIRTNIASGIHVDGGCTVNGHEIASGYYKTINSNGTTEQ